jgi:hypothetical protein
LMKEHFIMDGRHRYRACRELGIEPKFVQFDGDDVFGEIFSRNLFRRNLTPLQRAELVAKTIGGKLSADAQTRQKSGLKRGAETPVVAKWQQRGRTTEKIAEIAKVSPRTVHRALELLKLKSELPKERAPKRKKRVYKLGSDEWRNNVIRKSSTFLNRWPVTEHREVKRVVCKHFAERVTVEDKEAGESTWRALKAGPGTDDYRRDVLRRFTTFLQHWPAKHCPELKALIHDHTNPNPSPSTTL